MSSRRTLGPTGGDLGIEVDEVRRALVRSGVEVAGIGLDVVDVDAFAEQLDVDGSTFLTAAFTAGERSDVVVAHAEGPRVDARRLASRFAAKEAFVKAWSNTRFGEVPQLPGWSASDIEVVVDAWGRSRLRLHGPVAVAVSEHFGDDWALHLSCSHDGPLAAAVVVLAATSRDATSRDAGSRDAGR